jgi:hypothetical protein
LLQKRLAEELEDEREQHQKDLAERDFTIDQTRKKYQGALQLLGWYLVQVSEIVYLQRNWHS